MTRPLEKSIRFFISIQIHLDDFLNFQFRVRASQYVPSMSGFPKPHGFQQFDYRMSFGNAINSGL